MKINKMLPYLIIYLFGFYLLPILNNASWWLLDCLMVYMPCLCLVNGIIYGFKNGFTILLPIFCAIILLPATGIYFDEVLYAYAMIYAMISLIGIIIGIYSAKGIKYIKQKRKIDD